MNYQKLKIKLLVINLLPLFKLIMMNFIECNAAYINSIYKTERQKLDDLQTSYQKLASRNVKCTIKRDDDIRDSDLEMLQLSRDISDSKILVETFDFLNDTLSSNMKLPSKLKLIELIESNEEVPLIERKYPGLLIGITKILNPKSEP